MTGSWRAGGSALGVLVGPPYGNALEQDWDAVWKKLLAVGETVSERALEPMRELAQTTAGAHRRRSIDYLIAACAEAAGDVVLWHWDEDLAHICVHGEIPHEPEHERAKASGINVEPGEKPAGSK